MDGFSISRPPLGVALALLLLVVGALSLPPLQLIQRTDRALYDTWSAAATSVPPDRIVLVYLRDPAWHQALLNLARHQGARLVISTLPQPPAGGGTDAAIGPVVLASGTSMVVRETDWTRGGHLWIRKDFDGVVRQEWPVLEAGTQIPSLALAGARRLTPGTKSANPIASDTLNLDPQGRRWLKFYEDGFAELTPSDLLATPAVLNDKVVIAGREATGRYVTPIGALTTRELIAHSFAGYLDDDSVTTGGWWPLLGWLVAGTMVVALALVPVGWGVSAMAALAGSGALLFGSAIAFLSQAYWLPVAGPAWLLLACGGYLAWTRKHPAASKTARRRDTNLTDARRLAARGELEEAWTLYHRMRLDQMMLGELYDLGRALHGQGAEAMAMDVFHRIAQVDAGYRDVTSRLIKASDKDTVPQPENGERIRHLGRYQLLEQIGNGAMGVVYLGKDPKINRIVAIKAIDMAVEFEAEYIDEARNRFIREAETAGRLNHPNIVTIFDVGEEKSLAYIAMEFLKGQRLDDFTEPDNLLPVPLVLELLARTAEALHYAHGHDVVHRDIKPANIMYDSTSDTLKITDFGIARLMDVNRTQTGIVLGTPSFMSPEQLEGENVNGHTDLFALGVSLYQLLTGHLPFRGASMTQLMFVIANEPHVPVTSIRADLPHCLDRIMDKALAKDPASRYESGAEMALALREVVAEVS